MTEVTFVLKTFLASILIVLTMQIKINSRTVENHMLVWIHSSSVTQYLQQVAMGASKGIHQVETQAHVFFKKNFGKKNANGSAGAVANAENETDGTDDIEDNSVQKAGK